MSQKKKKKRPPYLEIIMGELILLMLLISLSIHLVNIKGFSITLPTGKINLVEGIDKQLTKRAVEAVLSEKAGASIDLDAIEESMESQDASAVDEILDKYANADTVKQAAEAYRKNSGNVSGILEDLKDNIDTDDLQKLVDIYEKYSPVVFEETRRAAQ